MADYTLDLNDCLEISVSAHVYKDLGIINLHVSKVVWNMIEKYRGGAAFKPRVNTDTLDILGSKNQVIQFIVKIISSFMDDEDLWRLFIQSIKRLYSETGDGKWLSILPYKPHEVDMP